MRAEDRLSEWLRQYQRGDGGVLAKLYSEAAPDMLNDLSRWVRDRTLAENLLQDAFLRIHKVRHTYRPEIPARAWLNAIARYVAIHSTRRQVRSRRMSAGEAKGGWGAESFEPPPFEETRILELTEQTLPVRPLRSAFERTLILAILGLGLGALALTITSLRPDLQKLSWAAAYAPALLEFLAGALVFWLAMGRAVPGSVVRYSLASLSLGGALSLALAAALAAPHLVPPDHPGLHVGSGPGTGLQCAGWQFLVALPVFLLSLWFILRGATVSPILAGALSGLGAGLLSGAAVHLQCPAVDPLHTVTWHFGTVTLMTALGALIGRALPKW